MVACCLVNIQKQLHELLHVESFGFIVISNLIVVGLLRSSHQIIDYSLMIAYSMYQEHPTMTKLVLQNAKTMPHEEVQMLVTSRS